MKLVKAVTRERLTCLDARDPRLPEPWPIRATQTGMSALADQTRWMDATDQAALVATGEVSPSELLEAAIERIERIDAALNAVVIRWFDHARETSASADLPSGPFRGVPFLIKDLFATYAGQRISNGNVAFKEAHVIADADTTLVSRYRAAGLVITGRTNSPELGSVPTTEPVAWGPAPNPWDTTRTPGGSSGAPGAGVGAVPPRRRRRRIVPLPGVVLRPRRAQAEPGSHHARPDPRRERTVGRALRQPHRFLHGR